MIPVKQSIVDPDMGDCHRAVIASLLELHLDQVPHFKMFADSDWHYVYHAFLWGCGYEWSGTGYPTTHLDPALYPNINGFVEASVPSLNFEGKVHSVVMRVDGVVVHDPSPLKSWEGINVLKTGDLRDWSLIAVREDAPPALAVNVFRAEPNERDTQLVANLETVPKEKVKDLIEKYYELIGIVAQANLKEDSHELAKRYLLSRVMSDQLEENEIDGE